MRKLTRTKKVTALFLSIAMLMLTACNAEVAGNEPSTGDGNDAPLTTYAETTENVKKSENVFINMDANGNVSKISVSDWIHADRGNVQISDITTLKDFTVTKGQNPIIGENGKLTWHMTDSDVYYEGVSDKQLPISISIKYYLDGVETAPKDLVGKTGSFKMDITMINNIKKEVDFDGTKMTMYAPLAALGGLMLPYENFTNIKVENGISVGSGSYEVVVMAGTPGLDESLGLSKMNISGMENISLPSTFSITADVTDFKLADTYFAAMPLSELNLDISVPETLEDAKNILEQLQDISKLIETIDPNKVLANFISDSAAVREMLDVVKEGLSVYNSNKKMLETMSTLLTPENIETLTNFINSVDAQELQSMLNNPLIQTFIGSLGDLATNLDEVMPILDEFSAAMEDPEIAQSMENLPQTLETLSKLMNYLNENQELLDIMSKLMESDNINSLTDAMDEMANSTADMAGVDADQATAEAQALLEKMKVWLSLEYTIYTTAPDYMETTCMFIYKTDPIK